MKISKNVRIGAIVAGIACLSMLVPAGTAGAHRNVCHMHHACPSDHATYRWHGLLCVKPTSPKNDGSFHKRVRQGGLPYLCKR